MPDDEPSVTELFKAEQDEALAKRHAAHANKQTEIRAQTLIESAKSLALINGGGAVAVAAFLGQIWDKTGAQPMRPFLLGAIGCLALGVAFASVLPYLRYRNSLAERSLEAGASPWGAHHNCTILSVAEFVLGMGLVVIGGLRSL
jgi:hypothetical protein